MNPLTGDVRHDQRLRSDAAAGPGATPLVSVALCTYNGEQFLPEQLDSLLAQTYPHFEIVAVDDASTDRSFEILTEYSRRDRRLRCLRNPRNLGFVRNFETALSHCSGELLALCDQDDVWLPEKLAVLTEALLRGGAALAFCNSELIDAHGNSLGLRLTPKAQGRDFDSPAPLAFHSPCAGHASLIRRDVVQLAMPFPQGIYHDWWLSFVAASAGRVVYVDRCLVRYRRHGDSITTRIDEGPRDRGRGFKLREMDEAERKLELFAAFPGRGQGWFRELLQLWRARRKELVSCRLAWFMMRHRRSVFLFRADSDWERTRLVFTYLWGVRLKRWLEPRRYGA